MIELRNFGLSIDGIGVLTNINYKFEERGVTAIVGPSGVGKSSLILSFGRLLESIGNITYRGEIFAHKKNILEKKTDLRWLRQEIGTVFQRPTPFPISIRNNLLSVLVGKENVKKSDFDNLMELALKKVSLWNELSGNLKTNALKLSGGQQQKLCFARVLLLDPKIIVLDEPCSSLDPISTMQIEELIVKLASEKKVIIVTHNLKQAKRISDKVIVIGKKVQSDLGTIIESGKTQELFSAPVDSFTKNYLEYELF